MANDSFASTIKALRFVKYFFPLAKYILLITLTIGLVMRMSGVECLTSDGSSTTGYKTPIVTNHIVEGDGNYESVTSSPAIYNPQFNNGPNKPPGAYMPAVETKKHDAYGKWVNSKVKIEAGQKFSIHTTGKVSLCKVQKTRRDIRVNADLHYEAPTWAAIPLPNPTIWENPDNQQRWAQSVQSPGTTGAVTLSADDSDIAVDANAGTVPLNVKPGDSIDIRINPVFSNSLSPSTTTANDNKWASQFNGPNYWDGNNDRGSLSPNYILDLPSRNEDVCSTERYAKPQTINYDDGKYHKSLSGGCKYHWSGPCSAACQWCRNEAIVADPGYACWNVHGKGLRGSIFKRINPTGPNQFQETFIRPDGDPLTATKGLDLNDLMNPLTRVENTTPGVPPIPQSKLTEFQRKDNYYGYYVNNVKEEGTLRFRIAGESIPNAHVPNLKSVGGYIVTVVITPSACEAYDGRAEINPASAAYDPTLLEAGTSPGFVPYADERGKIQARFVPIPEGGNQYIHTSDNPGGTELAIDKDGKLLEGTAPAVGTVWFKIKDVDHEPGMPHDEQWTYVENGGNYTAILTTYHDSGLISSLLMGLKNLIKPTLDDALRTTFTNLVESSNFMMSIRALVTLYLVFFFTMFVMGVIEINQVDFATRIVKIAIVLALISPGSFDYFNDHFFRLFSDGRDILINALTGGLGDPTNPFAFLDKTVGQMVQRDNVVRVLALFMVYPIGWFFVIMIILGMWTYITAMAKAMLSYFTAMVLVAFLLMMAPFFLAFMLFPITKSLFESWVKMLIRYTLEPVFLIVGLVILNEFVVIALHGIISHPACWKCAIPLDLGFVEDVLCFYFYLPWGYNASGSMMGLDFATQLFVSVFIFEITVNLAENYVQLSPRITATLTGTSALLGTNLTGETSAGGASIGTEMQTSINNAANDVKKTVARALQKGQQAMNANKTGDATGNKAVGSGGGGGGGGGGGASSNAVGSGGGSGSVDGGASSIRGGIGGSGAVGGGASSKAVGSGGGSGGVDGGASSIRGGIGGSSSVGGDGASSNAAGSGGGSGGVDGGASSIRGGIGGSSSVGGGGASSNAVGSGGGSGGVDGGGSSIRGGIGGSTNVSSGSAGGSGTKVRGGISGSRDGGGGGGSSARGGSGGNTGEGGGDGSNVAGGGAAGNAESDKSDADIVKGHLAAFLEINKETNKKYLTPEQLKKINDSIISKSNKPTDKK